MESHFFSGERGEVSPQDGHSCPASPAQSGFLSRDLALTGVALLFFFLLGLGYYRQALRPRFPADHLVHLPLQQELILLGQLDRPSRVRPEGVRLFLAVTAWKGPDGWRRVRGRLLVTVPPLTPPPVGTPVVLKGKLREPEALRNPGAFPRPRQLAAEGIFREMHLRESHNLVFLAGPGGPSLSERLRGRIREHLQQLPPATEAILLSMLLGDQGKVTPEMRQNLSRTGTSHLLVINGMHLGAVATVTFFAVFGLLRLFPRLLLRLNALKVATVAAAFPVAGYARLAGGSPSTQRAEIMVLTYLLLLFLGRGRDLWSALGLAAFGILLLSPLLLFSVSFQLSFAAVAGIWFLVPHLRPGTGGDPGRPASGSGWRTFLRRAGARGGDLLAVSLAASLATAPLVAHHFQVVSLFGFLVNLAAIPLVLLVALPLGELAILAQALSVPQAAETLLRLAHYPVRLGYELISRVAALPGSGVNVPSPSWLQVVLLYLLLILIVPVRRGWWSWAGAALTGAALAVTLLPASGRPPGSMVVTVLDSRVGLEALVLSPQGKRLGVTAAPEVWPGFAGGGSGALPEYLRWRQIRRLDLLVMLALTPRNAPMVLAVAQQCRPGAVWWEGGRPAGIMVDLMNLLGDQGTPLRPLPEISADFPPQARSRDFQLEFLPFREEGGGALKLSLGKQTVLFLPPGKRKLKEMPGILESLAPEVVVAPEEWGPELAPLLPSACLILYGAKKTAAGLAVPHRPRLFHTRDGAVTVTISSQGGTCSQYQP